MAGGRCDLRGLSESDSIFHFYFEFNMREKLTVMFFAKFRVQLVCVDVMEGLIVAGIAKWFRNLDVRA